MTEETLKEMGETLKRLNKLFLKVQQETETGAKERLENQIKELLNDLNMRHSSGRTYLEKMVQIYYVGPMDLLSTQKVYELVANRNKATTDSVRHAISYAIKTIYNTGNQKVLQQIIGTKNQKNNILPNELFVTAIVKYLKQQD